MDDNVEGDNKTTHKMNAIIILHDMNHGVNNCYDLNLMTKVSNAEFSHCHREYIYKLSLFCIRNPDTLL